MTDSVDVHFMYIRTQLDKLDRKMDAVNDQVIKTEEASQNARVRLDAHEKVLESHKAAINRGYGVVAGIGFITGGVGAFLAKVLG